MLYDPICVAGVGFCSCHLLQSKSIFLCCTLSLTLFHPLGALAQPPKLWRTLPPSLKGWLTPDHESPKRSQKATFLTHVHVSTTKICNFCWLAIAMGKLPNWTALMSFETLFLDFKSFHICLKLDFMWLQPSLNVSVSHVSRLAWPRPLLSFPLTFLSSRAHCCLLLNLVSS